MVITTRGTMDRAGDMAIITHFGTVTDITVTGTMVMDTMMAVVTVADITAGYHAVQLSPEVMPTALAGECHQRQV